MSIWLQKRRLNKVTWSIEKYPPNKFKISITEITIRFFFCFLNLKTMCALQIIAFWIQVASFLQLLRGSLRPAGKHSCGKARQKGVKTSAQWPCTDTSISSATGRLMEGGSILFFPIQVQRTCPHHHPPEGSPFQHHSSKKCMPWCQTMMTTKQKNSMTSYRMSLIRHWRRTFLLCDWKAKVGKDA